MDRHPPVVRQAKTIDTFRWGPCSSEENALSFCDGQLAVAYVTHEPCLACTRSLIRRGVRRVVFANPYVSIAPQEAEERASILAHFGVSWEQWTLN